MGPMGTNEDVVVADVGGKVFTVPVECEALMPVPLGLDDDTPPDMHVHVVIRMRNGTPHITSATITPYAGPLSPRQLAGIPWRLLAEGALIRNVSSDRDERLAVVKERRRLTREAFDAEHSIAEEAPKLKAEAQALGIRWDTYAAEHTGYSANYLRQLVARLEREARQ